MVVKKFIYVAVFTIMLGMAFSQQAGGSGSGDMLREGEVNMGNTNVDQNQENNREQSQQSWQTGQFQSRQSSQTGGSSFGGNGNNQNQRDNGGGGY